MPTVDDMLAKIPTNCKFFTQIDLKEYFHQLALHPDSQIFDLSYIDPKTGNVRYCTYLVLPMGFVDSPIISTSILTQVVFKDMTTPVHCYIDDITIPSKYDTLEEHLTHELREVFDRLLHYNLQINLSKTNVFVPSMDLLGFHIKHGSIGPVQHKVQQLQEYKPPVSIKELQTFLGAVQFYRRFIPAYSLLVAPLTNLLKKGTVLHPTKTWSPGTATMKAFDNVKSALASLPTLKSVTFNVNTIFYVYVDSSILGVGACLHVYDEELKEEVVIDFFSTKFHFASNTKLASHYFELLGITKALAHWQFRLLGCQKVVVFTDHKSLLGLFKNFENINLIKLNLLTQLLQYNLEFRYIPGEKLTFPDWLSRFHQSVTDNESVLIVPEKLNSTNLKYFKDNPLKGHSHFQKTILELSSSNVENSPHLRYNGDLYDLTVVYPRKQKDFNVKTTDGNQSHLQKDTNPNIIASCELSDRTDTGNKRVNDVTTNRQVVVYGNHDNTIRKVERHKLIGSVYLSLFHSLTQSGTSTRHSSIDSSKARKLFVSQQQKDKHLLNIIKLIKSDPNRLLAKRLSTYHRLKNQFTMIDDILYKVSPKQSHDILSHGISNEVNKYSIVIPQHLANEVILDLHMAGHHLKKSPLIHLLSNYYYIFNVNKMVDATLNSCKVCSIVPHQVNRKEIPIMDTLASKEVPDRFLHLIVDLWQAPTMSFGDSYVIGILDDATSFLKYIPSPNSSFGTVSRLIFEHWIAEYGFPTTIYIDQGKGLFCTSFIEVMALFNIKVIPTTRRHGGINRIERCFRTLNHLITKSLADLENNNGKTSIHEWYKQLKFIQFGHNIRKPSRGLFSPFEMTYVRKPLLPIFNNDFTSVEQRLPNSNKDLAKLLYANLHELYDIQNNVIDSSVTKNASSRTKQGTMRTPIHLAFNINDRVLRFQQQKWSPKDPDSRKNIKNYSSGWIVSEVSDSKLRYKIRNIRTNKTIHEWYGNLLREKDASTLASDTATKKYWLSR